MARTSIPRPQNAIGKAWGAGGVSGDTSDGMRVSPGRDGARRADVNAEIAVARRTPLRLALPRDGFDETVATFRTVGGIDRKLDPRPWPNFPRAPRWLGRPRRRELACGIEKEYRSRKIDGFYSQW